MTRYYDKHGTEIREGDTLRCELGHGAFTKNVHEADKVRDPSVFEKYWTVLSRADGTPVARYRGDQDVQLGDVMIVSGAESREFVVDGWGNETVHTRNKLGGCTFAAKDCHLIRRAGESERAAHVRHEERERNEDWCRHYVHCAPQAECYHRANPDHARVFDEQEKQMDALRQQLSQTRYADAPILGHDRNGREVRRGDRVRGPSGNIYAVETVRETASGVPAFSTGMQGIDCALAELVDDKAGQDDERPLFAMIPTEAAAAYWVSEFCRALAQPTMGERFERFKTDIGAILADFPTITATYDTGTGVFDKKPAPFVVMRCAAINSSGTAWCYQDVLEYIAGLKEEIGDDVLTGRAILRGGK